MHLLPSTCLDISSLIQSESDTGTNSTFLALLQQSNNMSAKESKVLEDIQTALEKHSAVSTSSITNRHLEDPHLIPLNIAITGQSGSGKSTFLDAFREISITDDRAASTDRETTMNPGRYPHPLYPKVTVWDLPGIGTTKFPADQYTEKVKFETYDLFIIVSAGRFRENDAKLAQEIKKMGKKFYFVCSKIDQDLRNEQRSQKDYSEEKTLQKIRESCIKGLEEQGVANPRVFLVSSFDLCLYDFPALHETFQRELPTHRRDVVILPVTKKKEAFSSQMKYFALLSAGVAAVPIPGLSFAADVGILVGVLRSYLHGFHLDVKSLDKCSSAKPLDDLRAVIKCLCSPKDVAKNLAVSMLRSLPLVTMSGLAEEHIKWNPFRIPVEASLSFIFIYTLLSSSLTFLSVAAEKVELKALDIKKQGPPPPPMFK